MRKHLDIKLALLELGISQADFAESLGIKPNTFSAKLNGWRNFTDNERRRIAEALDSFREAE